MRGTAHERSTKYHGKKLLHLGILLESESLKFVPQADGIRFEGVRTKRGTEIRSRNQGSNAELGID